MSGVNPKKPQTDDTKAASTNDQQQIRQRLLEMIRRNEAMRRLKPR